MRTPSDSVFSSVQSLSHVQLFVTPWIAARQASLSITNSRSLLKLMSIESMMPSSHLILCRPLLLLPPVPPSIRVFSSESTLRMRWPKYWSFSFSISPCSESPLDCKEILSYHLLILNLIFSFYITKHLFKTRRNPTSIYCPEKRKHYYLYFCSNTVRIKELFLEVMRFLQITFTHRIWGFFVT